MNNPTFSYMLVEYGNNKPAVFSPDDLKWTTAEDAREAGKKVAAPEQTVIVVETHRSPSFLPAAVRRIDPSNIIG